MSSMAICNSGLRATSAAPRRVLLGNLVCGQEQCPQLPRVTIPS